MPGKFESSNVSRDNVSREIGRTGLLDLISPCKLPEVSPETFGGFCKNIGKFPGDFREELYSIV